MKLFLITIFLIFFLSFSLFAFAQQDFQLPAGEPWTLQRVLDEVLGPIANFLIVAGITVAVITIVLSGIIYLTAGSSDRVSQAKKWFKNGIIGALIVLGVGVILNTVQVLVTGEFFGILPGGGGGGEGPASSQQSASSPIGSRCEGGRGLGDEYCAQWGLVCKGICQRPAGNAVGEPCTANANCDISLVCDKNKIQYVNGIPLGTCVPK